MIAKRMWIGAAAAFSGALAGAPVSAEPREVTATTASETAAALAEIEDHDVVLLAVSAPLAEPADHMYLSIDGARRTLEECGFGPIDDAAEIGPLHDDNHLVAVVRLGAPGSYAANMAACEYAPNEELQQRLTIRGCYLALTYSIPTARGLVLNPLPAWACGLGR